MLQPSQNPPILAPWVETLGDLTSRWWVGHTKARNEKAFAWDLHQRGIAYFLPLWEKIIISGGRKRCVMMPLFPSYVFFCGSDQERYAALTTNRLARTIEVEDQDQLLRELSFLETALSRKLPLSPSSQLSAGQRCRITSGPLRGLEGLVVRRGNATRILLKVSIISGGALLEVESGLLEPLE